LRIEFSATARADLDAIHDYIAADNPDAAMRTIHAILRTIRSLAEFPALGRPWSSEDPITRSLVIQGLPYRVLYQANPESISIVTKVHTSRRFPD
jgi:toxin ParE1/3/4